MKRATTYFALLRGINVGGHNRVPMPELRALAHEAGFADVQSYIQSGNLILFADNDAATVEAELERKIERRFGLRIPVVVRSVAQWRDYIRRNPFPVEAQREPKHLLLALTKQTPSPGALAELRERATVHERIEQAGDALWIYFGHGVAGSKLTSAVLDRLIGSPVTMRNWLTVAKLVELAEARHAPVAPAA